MHASSSRAHKSRRILMNRIFAPLQQKKLRIWGMVVACGMTATGAVAQSPAPRIQAEVTNSHSTLRGSLHPFAQPQNDAGRMPGNSRLNGISIYFNRSAAQQADLQALLAAQQDRS